MENRKNESPAPQKCRHYHPAPKAKADTHEYDRKTGGEIINEAYKKYPPQPSPNAPQEREAKFKLDKITLDAIFNRHYVAMIFRKCSCDPSDNNRESVNVMDMQTWFSLVVDSVTEALLAARKERES